MSLWSNTWKKWKCATYYPITKDFYFSQDPLFIVVLKSNHFMTHAVLHEKNSLNYILSNLQQSLIA